MFKEVTVEEAKMLKNGLELRLKQLDDLIFDDMATEAEHIEFTRGCDFLVVLDDLIAKKNK